MNQTNEEQRLYHNATIIVVDDNHIPEVYNGKNVNIGEEETTFTDSNSGNVISVETEKTTIVGHN